MTRPLRWNEEQVRYGHSRRVVGERRHRASRLTNRDTLRINQEDDWYAAPPVPAGTHPQQLGPSHAARAEGESGVWEGQGTRRDRAQRAQAQPSTRARPEHAGGGQQKETDNGPDPTTPAGPHRFYDTRTKFDIEGNVLTITDARGVQVILQRFDVLQRRLRVDSPDAGARLAVADIAGKPLRAWDSRGQTMHSRYDALQRPTHVFVRQGAI